ncbi:cold-shock protein [Rhizobium sp. BE258]|jgi:hypothetical protein|uniref:cold-shock protein n=1 Tax=unclassified Rhizobium TaxID=2613769 RepID=UPI000DD9ABCC|nr:cold-shock protein [Rhizobium sp. BE258]MDR7144148.1 hypothetical protein [Rhizobium sp. BE258]
MTNRHYRPGDSIVLKPGILGSVQPGGAGRVVSVMPAAQGFVHYRVRFQNENCERSVRQDDIDVLASSGRPAAEVKVTESPKSSWINSNTIRIKK